LKNALERQQGKGAHANVIATQGFEDLKTTRCLQRDLADTERTLAGATPQVMQDCNPSSPNQRFEEIGT
jgi:hypothetical protein